MPEIPFTSRIRTAPPAGYQTPLLAIALREREGTLPAALADLDTQCGGALSRLLSSGDFRGKRDETALIHPEGPASRVLLVGLGKGEQPGTAAIRRAAAVAAKRAAGVGVPRMGWYLADTGAEGVERSFQAVAEGLAQGAWSYTDLKRPPEDAKPRLTEAELLVMGDAAPAERGHAIGVAVGAGHQVARGLQIRPGNLLTPERLAEFALQLGAKHGFPVTVLDGPGLEAEGMHALLAVGQGSAQASRFIALEYRGGEGQPVVLIGKGVTFDTGGISIKPAPQMEDMKFDMSGAAAVLGTFEALGRLRPRINVIGLIPSAENMPSSTAYKPGDVVKSHLGKTIEVINTDAEGRLLLADALSYARRYDPACVVDAATLTGAVVIGLGHVAAAVLGTDQALIDDLVAAGARGHERVWPLPLWDEYKDLIKSEIADVKNSGGRSAGTITAAWFLREFVEGFPWAHVDIAGTAYTDRGDPAQARGPTGMGVRLFCEFLLARAG